MLQFLFKYPLPVFTKGRFVFLSAWPAWLLPVVIVLASCGLALLIRKRRSEAPPKVRGWRGWAIWGMQSGLLALLLVLLWQPAITIGELSSHQNIIAVVVDDSKSMAVSDSNGRAREAAAVAALNGGMLAGLQNRFQTRLYRLDGGLQRVESTQGMAPCGDATHFDDGLKQLLADTSDLPLGAIVLMTDGSQNSSGLGGSGMAPDTMQALRNRRIPVHTVGFGREELTHDVEIEDVGLAEKAFADSRIAATVSLLQHGYVGEKATLTVRDGDKLLASREISLGPGGRLQPETVFFPAGAAGAKSLTFRVEPLAGEENLANNSVSRPLL